MCIPGANNCPYCLGNIVSEATGKPRQMCPDPTTLPPPSNDPVQSELEARAASMHSRKSILDAIQPKDYSDEFYTPDPIVDALGAFDLDPCAGPKSHAKRNVRKPECGLTTEWKGRVWMNPPYWRIHDWLAKFQAHGNGICLVNARPDAKWFQRLAEGSDAILWMRGRIQFEQPSGKKGHGPVGSVLVAYGKRNADALIWSGLPGFVTALCSTKTT